MRRIVAIRAPLVLIALLLGAWEFACRTLAVPAYFLPTYVAGIEATGHVQWASRCHSWAADFDLPAYVLGEAYTCAIALTITVIAGTAAAAALGHRSRFGIPIPAVVGAICASVAGPWWVLLRLVST